MKIGFFTESYLPQLDGVATSFVGTTVKALEDLGHEIYIIAPRYPGYKDKNKNVYRLMSIRAVKSPEIRFAIQVPEKSLFKILALDFDIIHGFPGLAGITAVGLQIAKIKNIPLVATYHTFFGHYTHYLKFPFSLLSPQKIDYLCRVVANRFDYLIAPVAKVKEEMISFGITKPIEIMPIGIDCENYRNIKKGYLREIKNIPMNKKILLYVGRLGEEKSVDFLLYAFKNILEKNPQTVFALVGTGPDKEKLELLVKELNIEKSVFFLGTIDHSVMPKIYADADIFIFASQTETQGMVVYEAAASGIPVVAVDDEIFSIIIKDGENGYLVEKNPEIFADKVVGLLTDEKLYKRFSEKTREIVKDFSTVIIAKRLEALYLRLIDQRKSKKKKSKIHYVHYLFASLRQD